MVYYLGNHRLSFYLLVCERFYCSISHNISGTWLLFSKLSSPIINLNPINWRLDCISFHPPAHRAVGVFLWRSGRAGGCQTCWTHISVTAWWICFRSVELSRPVVVHCHGHLPISPQMGLPMNKKTWHKFGTNYRMLDPFCEFELWPHRWPWPWIFQVKYWNCCISGMGWSTHLEWKGYELDMMLDAQWDWSSATVHGK